MTYDWSGRRMRRMRAAKLTIFSLVAAFVLTAPIFAHY
ncbi:polyferredoxin [Rhizobium sp. AN70]|jgi:polyferredoxin|nr:polyferredoxin [Rhizobium sp. AN70]